jgi:hypothetical protein
MATASDIGGSTDQATQPSRGGNGTLSLPSSPCVITTMSTDDGGFGFDLFNRLPSCNVWPSDALTQLLHHYPRHPSFQPATSSIQNRQITRKSSVPHCYSVSRIPCHQVCVHDLVHSSGVPAWRHAYSGRTYHHHRRRYLCASLFILLTPPQPCHTVNHSCLPVGNVLLVFQLGYVRMTRLVVHVERCADMLVDTCAIIHL